MKRYRVGAHVMIRVEIEVEANSPIEALGKVDDEDVRRAAERGEFPAVGAVELVSARPVEGSSHSPAEFEAVRATSTNASPLCCEHANEAPTYCPCPPGCYCKGRTCQWKSL